MKLVSVFILMFGVLIGCSSVEKNRINLPREKVRVAISGLNYSGVSVEEGNMFLDLLTEELENTGTVEPIERKEIEKLFKEEKFQATGAVDVSDTRYIAEIGRMFGVRLILIGQLRALNKERVVNVRIVDAQTAAIKALGSASYPAYFANSYDKIKLVAKKLANELAVKLVE